MCPHMRNWLESLLPERFGGGPMASGLLLGLDNNLDRVLGLGDELEA